MNINQSTQNTNVSMNERNDIFNIRRRIQRRAKRHRKKLAKQTERENKYELELFKRNLEIAVRQNNNIYDFIQDFKLVGTLTCVKLYGVELGAPTTCSYDDYFWRISAIIYYMFKELNVEGIEQISELAANAYMSQPEEYYIYYCATVHAEELKDNATKEEKLKETRMENIVIETEYNQLHDSELDSFKSSDCYDKYVNFNSFESKYGCKYFDCPICYDSCVKLNSYETECGHKYCEKCFTEYMMKLDILITPSCPLCRAHLNAVNYYTEIIMYKLE